MALPDRKSMKRIQNSIKQSRDKFQWSAEGMGVGGGRGEVCRLRPTLIIREGVIQGPGCETTPFGGSGLGIAKFKQSYNIIGLKLSLLS